MSLWAEFLQHDGRTVHKWKQYFTAYEAHFGRYVNRPLIFLEIGSGFGGSAQMWKRYFGPEAQIISIDNQPNCKDYEEDQIAIRIGDQSDTAFLNNVIEEFGAPDIVLDDGSHVMNDISVSFSFLYPRMAKDGVYMVEDLHTAYTEEYGGGLRRPGTFIETCKHLIDELNADWTGGLLESTDFSRSTRSMHFYDSIAVFERGRVLPKSPLMIPPHPDFPGYPTAYTRRGTTKEPG